MSALKLFVWCEPYPVDYGQSAVFAIAETVEQARIIARSDLAKSYSYFNIEQDGGGGSSIKLGEPDRGSRSTLRRMALLVRVIFLLFHS